MNLPSVRGRAFVASNVVESLVRLPSLSCLALGLAATATAQTVDGNIVGDGYPRLSVQTVNTQFGDNSNELNAGYGRIVSGKLYLALTGNFGSGANVDKLEIFLDVKSGGPTSHPGIPNNDGSGTAMSGMTFDTGFTPEYLIICRRNSSNNQFDLDIGELGTSTFDSITDVFSGSTDGTALAASASSPSILTSGIDVSYDDANSAGVTAGTTAATQADASKVRTGLELGITLSDLGYTTGAVRVSAFINNEFHTYVSNQVLGGLPSGTDNLGVSFNGNSGGIDFNNYAGDQFFTVPAPGTTYLEPMAEDLTASFAQAEIVELGDIDGDGDLDAVAYSASSGDIVLFYNSQSGIGWLPGDGTYSAPYLIATLPGTSQIQLIDVDGDGFLDVAAISPTSQELKWYYNPVVGFYGTPPNVAGGWATQSITANATSFVAADFDGQGDFMDFVVADSPGVYLIEDAAGAGTEISGFPTLELGPKRVVAGDFDSDGGPDVVMTATYSNGSIIGIMNTGAGSASFGNAFRIKGNLTGAKEMVVTDFDGLNGDDVIVCSESIGRVELFKSNGSGLNTFPTGSITGLAGALDVSLSDVDGDADLDVIVAEAGTSTVFWAQNLGGNLVVTRRDATSVSSASPAIAGGDIDGDGDGDVISGGAAKIEKLRSGYSIGYSVACSPPVGSAEISASGSSIADANSLTLTLASLPTVTVGYFINSYFASGSPGTPIVPGGSVSGEICIGGTGVFYGRHRDAIFNSGTSGSTTLTLDLNDIRSPKEGVSFPTLWHDTASIFAGETWYWQAWYRRDSTTSEFSDAIGITFR